MKKLYLSFILISFVNIGIANQLSSLPIPTGPYRVGTFKQDLYDDSRKDLSYPSGRLIPIQYYFPIKKGNHQLRKKKYETRGLDDFPSLKVDVYSEQVNIQKIFYLREAKLPVIYLNHGHSVSMTDYAYIAEDLASNGYLVVSIQHQLKTDQAEPKFLKERSIRRYANVIDNLFFVFNWMQENQGNFFQSKLDLSKVGFIGHSMGGSALNVLLNRASQVFKLKKMKTLLPYHDSDNIKEAVIVLDTGGFAYPNHNQYPLFLAMSEEGKDYQVDKGAYDDMIKIGHKVKYYKGSKHISFMDHGYVSPKLPGKPEFSYFNGSLEDRKQFFNEIRRDIRDFLNISGVNSG